MSGDNEFNQWLGITTSNKTWLWLMCMLVIGGCLGYLAIKLPKRLKRVRSRQ